MEENQRILLERAIGKIEQEYSGGKYRRLEVITELESPTTVNIGGIKLVMGKKIVICINYLNLPNMILQIQELYKEMFLIQY